MIHVRRLLWGLGSIVVFFSATFLLPAIIAMFYDIRDPAVRMRVFDLSESVHLVVPETALVFLLAGTITATFGLFLQYFGVEQEDLRHREAYAIVGLGWLTVALFGAIPYLALGILGPLDAYFESMSGFTTTGATVLDAPLQQYPASVLMWRAFMQWVGGMGIIVLGIALLAGLTHGGHQLMTAELSGLKGERIRPKVKETAKLLWSIYAALSLIVLVALTLLIHYTGVRLPWGEAFYEALLHTFTSISTGGFSNHDESIAYFQSIWVETILVLAMFTSAINFALLYMAWHRRSILRFFEDPEFRFYLGLTVAVCVFVSLVLFLKPGAGGETLSLGESLRSGILQSISITTTTGYTPAAFDDWPDAARLILLFMFFTGASAGSTSGGLKLVRILVLFKLVIREVRRLLHPRAIVPIRLGNTILKDDTLKTVSVFFFTYISLFILGTILFTLMDLDLVSAISASASSIGNIGPALGTVHAGFHQVPAAGKLVSILLMWFGRLEIFTTLILLSPATWRR